MKKLILVISCVFIILGLCGCQNNIKEKEVVENNTEENNVEENENVELPIGTVIEGGVVKYFDADPEKTPLIHEAIQLYYAHYYEECREKFLSALEQGEFDPIAYYFLGQLYQYGDGVEKNIDTAYEYYAKGYEYEHTKCMYYIGLRYEDEGDDETAEKIYKRIIELGDPLGYLPLVSLYHYSDTLMEKAYVKKAVESKEPYVICCIADFYYTFGDNKYWETATELYKIAGELGHAYSLLCVGNAYEIGSGVAKDPKKAYEYYLKGAETYGHPDDYIYVGHCYEYGIGVEKDVNKAIEYYELSTEDGKGEGWNLIGYIYEKGQLVERDYTKAAEYYEKGFNARIPSLFAKTRYDKLKLIEERTKQLKAKANQS